MTNTNTASALAHTITEHLGPDWTVTTSADTDSPGGAHLHGPNNMDIRLTLGTHSHRKADHGRVIITGHFGPLGAYIPDDLPHQHRITVNERTGPARIAHEIQHRLLPSYLSVLHAAAHAKHISDDLAAERAQLATNVASLLGVRERHDTHDFAFGTVHDSAYGRARIRTGTSVFTIKVPHDRVADFAQLLGTFGHLR